MIKFAAAIALCIFCTATIAQDARYCGRDTNVDIKRNGALIDRFERLYPLPAMYKRSDWQVDHVIPLASGGCDAIINLQWLPKNIKTCAGLWCKDRWERRVYEQRPN